MWFKKKDKNKEVKDLLITIDMSEHGEVTISETHFEQLAKYLIKENKFIDEDKRDIALEEIMGKEFFYSPYSGTKIKINK